MMSNGNTAAECIECSRLLARYEAATFEQARIHNALDLAERCGDYTSTRYLKLEAFAVTARRNDAHAAYVEHEKKDHRFAGLIGLESPLVAIGMNANVSM
jgi:hypothetical protein